MSLKTNATLRYTAMRLAIFAACFLAVWGLTHFGLLPAGIGSANPLWVLLLALVLSAPLSYVLLRGQRDAMSAQIAGRVDRAKERLSDNRKQEDVADDAARARS